MSDAPAQEPQHDTPSTARRNGRGGGVAATHALVKELDQQYRASRKDWKHPSPAFSKKGERFAPTKQLVDAQYEVDVPEHRPSSKRGTFAADRTAQRPPTRELACKGVYDPKSPNQGKTSSKGLSAFASTSPRHLEDKRLPGQHQVYVGNEAKARAADAASTMRSRSPRFSDAPVWTRAQYDQTIGTMGAASAASKGKGSSWAKSRTAQRPEPRKLVDKQYDVAASADKRNPSKAAFAGATERFPEEKPRAPPVGQYTSPIIAAGMLTE